MKSLTSFAILCLFLVSCTGEYAVEDELYACIEKEFASNALNLEAELDSLEILFIDEGIIESAAPEDYRNYYQENINQGILRGLSHPYYLNLKMSEISLVKLQQCALRKFDGETYDESRFGQISNRIDATVNATGQITFGTVAEAHLEVLSADDFEHPFYRANVLLSLQWLYFNHYLRDERYLQ